MNEQISKSYRVVKISTKSIECVDLFSTTGKIGTIFVPFNDRLSIPTHNFKFKHYKLPDLYYFTILANLYF